MITGIEVFGDRDTLLDSLGTSWPLYVTIHPCSTTAVFPGPGYIPESDMPCPCGDETHWILRYRKEAPALAKGEQVN
jgi:hypothetical protein